MTAHDDALLRLETDRLILRPFTEADLPLILRISSDEDTVKYLYYWGLNGITPEDDALRFYHYARKNWEKRPIRAREYCVLRRDTGEAIGDGSVEWVEGQAGTAEIGWILTKEHRSLGFATEMGRELLRAAFDVLGADRVIAHCDARNRPSARVMERLGMHLDDVTQAVRPAKREGETKGDECTYGILRGEWEEQRAWAAYRAYTCVFDGFPPIPEMSDGDLALRCEKVYPADPAKGHVPAYQLAVLLNETPIGTVSLRIGYPDSLFYGGQIGYGIDEPFRGQGYAGRAVCLLRPLLRLHGMRFAVITNDVYNVASRRVCEKLGARYLCVASLPEDSDLYREGQRQVRVFSWDAEA